MRTRLLPGIDIIDLGLYLCRSRTLVFGDFHLGYEDSLHAHGVLVPRFQLHEITKRVDAILSSIPKPPETIILNGDLKHDFGRISPQEWREALTLIDRLLRSCAHLIIVKGNHDVVLDPVLKKRSIAVVEKARIGNVLVLHGDELSPSNDASVIIIGHEHPAVGIRHGSRLELYKCFLLGTYHGKTLIAMPSFHTATEGTDILRQQRLSPFLSGRLDQFKVFVIADTVYPFGTVKDLQDEKDFRDPLAHARPEGGTRIFH